MSSKTLKLHHPGPGDWILHVPRDGQKEGMLKSYRLNRFDAPIQDIELNPKSIPFEIAQPAGDQVSATKPVRSASKSRSPIEPPDYAIRVDW